ncbi:unnamed protein product [Macrosiphum euphorbiae]|uniref:Uncharacterized protein n=1 Tax=Macrosiphum euphorbiae TaxID=13131 RepID=A0AAV0WQ93_9HEMI|nr:unnamed protein product [Macrosiphum euphorbiae]
MDIDKYTFCALSIPGGLKRKENRSSSSMNDELTLYLANQVSPLTSDPLEQWEEIKNVFPLFYRQARLHFSIVATSEVSEPCER